MTSIDRQSVEIRTFTVTDTLGADLSSDTVDVAFVPQGTRPDTGDWITCQWTADTPGSVDVKFNMGTGSFDLTDWGGKSYKRYVRITDSPEIPIIEADDRLDVK